MEVRTTLTILSPKFRPTHFLFIIVSYSTCCMDEKDIPRADSESPESIAVLGSGQTIKSVRAEGVAIVTPNRRCTVQVVGIDDDGRPRWDIVAMNNFGVVSKVGEGES